MRAKCLNSAPLKGHDLRRVIKFSLVGLSGVGVNVGTLWLFTDVFGVFYIVSAILAHFLSVTNNFTWNQLWTFQDRFGHTPLQIIVRWAKYVATTGFAAGLYLGTLTLCTEVFGLYYLISSLIAIAVATPVNFLACNFWVWTTSICASEQNKPR